MNDQIEIFVSYAWGGDSERTVDELEAAFASRGLSIVRDKKDLGYKGSIEAFEQRIGRGKVVILVISDKYLRSKHCMYELVEAAENRDLRARIFPIVLPDAQIYDAVDRLAYIQFWDAQIDKLNQAIKSVNVMSNLAGISADLDLYSKIRANFDQLTDLLSDMNTLTPEIHASSGYNTLMEAIETEVQKSAVKETEKMSEEDATKKSEEAEDKGGVNVGSISDVSGSEINIAGRDVQKTNVDTGGGAHISGINTGGGDFVARDKVTRAESGGIAISGNVSGSTIGSTTNQQVQYIQQIYKAIEERPNTSDYDKVDLKQGVKDIETEDAKGEQADPGFIEHRLRNIQRMAPDILEVVLATIANPVAGFGMVAKKVAERMKAEAGS